MQQAKVAAVTAPDPPATLEGEFLQNFSPSSQVDESFTYKIMNSPPHQLFPEYPDFKDAEILISPPEGTFINDYMEDQMMAPINTVYPMYGYQLQPLQSNTGVVHWGFPTSNHDFDKSLVS